MPAAPRSAFRRVLANSLWFAASETGGRVLSLLAVLYLTRTLTRAGLGVVEFGMSIFTLTHMISVGGSGTLAARRAARNTRDIGGLAAAALLVAWCHWAALMLLVGAGAWLLPRPPAMRLGMALFGLAAGVVPLGMRFILMARERARVVAAAVIAGQATYLALCLIAVRGPDDAAVVPLALLAAMSVQAGVQLLGFVVAYGAVRLRRGAARFGPWLRATVAIDRGVIARPLSLVVDLLLLGVLVVPEEVARYGIALKVPLFLLTLTNLAHGAIFPSVARTRARAGDDRLTAIHGDTVRAALGVTLPGVLCLGAIAEPLMVLLFTDHFRAAAPLFTVLLWRVPLTAVSGLFRNLVWSARPTADARIAVLGLMVSVAAILLLVPRIGAMGAALGILLGDVVLLLLNIGRAPIPLAALARGDHGFATRLVLGLALAAVVASRTRTQAAPVAIAAALAAWGVASLLANARSARRLWSELAE